MSDAQYYALGAVLVLGMGAITRTLEKISQQLLTIIKQLGDRKC